MRLIVIYLVLTSTAIAQDSSWIKENLQFGGYLKELATGSFINTSDSINFDNLVHNRLNVKLYPSNALTLSIEVRNRFFSGSSINSPGFSEAIDADPGYADMSWNLVDNESILLNSKIDRLSLNVSAGQWDITLGRQRINWGINMFWNSNDLFNAYSFVDFDYEERPGSDAIRVQRFFKNMSSVEVAVKADSEEEVVAAMLYRFNKWQYDFQLLAGVYYNDVALGAGWAGNIGLAGFKGEATYFHPQESYSDTSGTLSASLSFDYVFNNSMYVNTSFLFNSLGQSASSSFQTVFFSQLSAKSLMPAKYSILAQTSYTFNPLLSGSAVVLFSPGVNTMFIMPSLSWSAFQNIEVSLHGQVYYAEVQEKFENLGNGIFLRGRWSF